MSIERVKEMESLYQDVATQFEEFQYQLEQFKTTYNDYLKLRSYYESEAWFEDYQLYEDNLIPADQTCAILAEDTIYNLMVDERQLSIDLLDTASSMLKS